MTKTDYCPHCGKEINIGKMMVQRSLQGKTPEELRKRTRKASAVRWKGHKKLSPTKKKKVLRKPNVRIQ